MPTETAIVIAAIVVVFSIFAVVLAYADYRTRRLTKP